MCASCKPVTSAREELHDGVAELIIRLMRIKLQCCFTMHDPGVRTIRARVPRQTMNGILVILTTVTRLSGLFQQSDHDYAG